MRVDDLMTRDVACCQVDTPLQDVARLMAGCNCGMLPVVDDLTARRIMGVITDRDIVVRATAVGASPFAPAGPYMTPAPRTVRANDSLEAVEDIMTQAQVRRVPVVDSEGCCVGVVSQADIALAAPSHVMHVVTEVSKPARLAA